MRAALLWTWVVMIAVATVWVFLAAGGSHPRGEPTGLLLVILIIPVSFTALGVVIATRQPGNGIAWLLVAMGFSLLLTLAADFHVGLEPPPDPTMFDALAVVWFQAGYQLGLFIPIGLLLHIFPTGKFLTPRWVWAGWAAGIAAFFTLFAEIALRSVTPIFPPGLESWTIPNPIGFTDNAGMGNPLFAVILGLTVLPLIFGGVVSLVKRYRSSDAVIRAQIRWVVLALISVVFVGIVPAFAGFYGPTLFISLLFIPVSVTIAITRYRLFDIDRLISRTVGYAIVIGVLALVFALIVTVPGMLLGGVGEDGKRQEAPPILVAASTLAIAALFNPLRRRVLRGVDRRFNRSRYDAEQVVERIGARIPNDADVDEIVGEAVAVVQETMQPALVGAWVRD